MSIEQDHKSWWATLPGIITSLATLITAIGGLLVILNANGYFSPASPKSVDGVLGAHSASGDHDGHLAVGSRSSGNGSKSQFFSGNLANSRQAFNWRLTLMVIMSTVLTAIQSAPE